MSLLDDPRRILSILTPRELDVTTCRCQGHTNQGVARALGMDYSTVKNHVSSVLKKLQLGSIDEVCYYLGRCDERRLLIDGQITKSIRKV